MRSAPKLRSLQVEVIASLFAVVLAGLAVVALVMGTLTTRGVESSVIRELRMGARHLERVLMAGPTRLEDLAALVRSTGPQALGGSWIVLDARGRELGRSVDFVAGMGRARELARAALAKGEVVDGGGWPPNDLWFAVSVRAPGGEAGTLVGRVSAFELRGRLIPTLYSGAWVLVVAAGVFVVFGSWLLRGRIVRPLQELSSATRKVAAGDLRVELPAVAPRDWDRKRL